MAKKAIVRTPKDVVFVLGAGVDVALGLPLMSTLFRDLHMFAKGEGKAVDRAIRKHVRIRFSLETYAGDEGEQLGQKLLGSGVHLLPVILKALGKYPDPKNSSVLTIKTLIAKLAAIARENELKGDTVSELLKIAGASGVGALDDTLLDTDHVAFRPPVRQAMRRVFTTMLAETPTLTEGERNAFEALVAALSNFEEMLGEFFAGYFTRNPTNQKRYFYLSWLLWAYIRVKEEAGRAGRDQSFYKTLSEIGRGSQVITFNYTDFFCGHTRPRNGYFHGDSRSYIRFDTRDYITDDAAATEADTVDKMAAFIEALPVDWAPDVPLCYLPAIVPPLSVKPIICTEYLERWYKCGQMIKTAKSIVILGYSFNVADEHFNDLIRKQNHTAKLLVVNPSIEPVINEVCRITEQDKAVLVKSTVDAFECTKGGRLTFLKARAEELKGSLLIKLLNE